MLRSFARWLLRAWDGIGRPKAARASEGLGVMDEIRRVCESDAGVRVLNTIRADLMHRAYMQQPPDTLLGKPIRYADDLEPIDLSEYVQSVDLSGEVSPWRTDDYLLSSGLGLQNCRCSTGEPPEIAVPDTFPEEWRRE